MKVIHAGILKAIVLPVLIGAVLSLCQRARILECYGVNPGLSLVGLAVFFALAPAFLNYALLFLSEIIFLQPLSTREMLALFVVGIVLQLVRSFAPWRAVARLIFSLVAGTVLFYAISDAQFLTGFFGVAAAEVLYNLFVGVMCYFVLRAFYRLFFGPYEAPE